MSSIAGCFPHNLPFSKFLSFLLFFFSSAVLCELGEAVRQNSDAWQFVDKCGDPGILGQLRAIMVHHIWIDISIRLYLPPLSLSLFIYIYYIYILLHGSLLYCTPSHEDAPPEKQHGSTWSNGRAVMGCAAKAPAWRRGFCHCCGAEQPRGAVELD